MQAQMNADYSAESMQAIRSRLVEAAQRDTGLGPTLAMAIKAMEAADRLQAVLEVRANSTTALKHQ